MLERGIVLKNSQGELEVHMQPNASCGSCTACSLDHENEQVLHIEQELNVHPGDAVEVEVNPGFALKSAFLIFFLPLLALFVGFFVFQDAIHVPRIGSDLRGILGAFLFMGITYFGVYLYDKHLQRTGRGKQVKVVKILK